MSSIHGALLPLCFAMLAAGDDVAAYLKGGMLTQALEIRDVQGGFAGFTGTSFKVEPDGHWTTAQVMNQKTSNEKKGKLTKEQLGDLAKALAKYDALNLKNVGKPMTNPHVVTIKFGKVEGTLNLPAGSPLPKVDPKAASYSVEERYGGIVQAVRELLTVKDDGK